MNNEIVFTITQDSISIPIEFEIKSDDTEVIIWNSFYEFFLLEKLHRDINLKDTIKYNRLFNLTLKVNSNIIFDTHESQFDSLRHYLKFNRSKKSRIALVKTVHQAIIQVLTKQFNPSEFQKLFIEGKTKTTFRNIYERNPKARKDCIKHYGTTCLVCSFDFKDAFGEIGNGFIHVHHLVPISSIKKEYQLDAIRDLRPVCPNCHAMIHKRVPPYTISELKDILKKTQGND